MTIMTCVSTCIIIIVITICMYVCMYIYIYIYIHIHTIMHICISLSLYIYIYIHIYIYTYICMVVSLETQQQLRVSSDMRAQAQSLVVQMFETLAMNSSCETCSSIRTRRAKLGGVCSCKANFAVRG